MFAGVAVLLTACSSKDDWNTDHTAFVEMTNATMKVKENAGLVKIPLTLTGTTNGPVQVTVSVSEVGEYPAVESENFLLTSNTVVFPNDSAQVGIEVYLINDMDVNENRTFALTITKVEGASIGNQTTTEVIIVDDEGMPYEAIQGSWTFSDENYFDEVQESFSVSITGVSDDDPGYESVLYISGMLGFNNLTAEAKFKEDENGQVTVAIMYGITTGQLNFTGLGVSDVVTMGVDDEGYLVTTGSMVGYADQDLLTITYDQYDMLMFGVFQNNEYLGLFDGVLSVVLSR